MKYLVWSVLFVACSVAEAQCPGGVCPTSSTASYASVGHTVRHRSSSYGSHGTVRKSSGSHGTVHKTKTKTRSTSGSTGNYGSNGSAARVRVKTVVRSGSAG